MGEKIDILIYTQASLVKQGDTDAYMLFHPLDRRLALFNKDNRFVTWIDVDEGESVRERAEQIFYDHLVAEGKIGKGV